MSRVVVVLALVVALLLPGAVLAQSPSVAPDVAGSWAQAVDEAGTPLFADGPVTPVAIVASGFGITAIVRDADGASQIWSTGDGDAWLPAEANGFDGRALDGLATAEDRWLAWSLPADGQPLAIWTSKGDRQSWTRMPDAGLAALGGATLTMIAGSLRGYVAVGTRQVDGRTETRHWMSEFGGDWKERARFADEHPAARVDWLGLMGYRIVDLGVTGAGDPMAWTASPTLRYSARLDAGRVPPHAGRPYSLVPARDAALVLARTADGTLDPWHSVDSVTWTHADLPPGTDPTGQRTAWAGGPTWMVTDTIAADGAHTLQASVDGITWTPLPADGAPTDGAVPLLAAGPYTIAMLTPTGIWTRLIGLQPPPPIAGSRPVVADIGADPPLRAPVTARLKDRRQLAPRGAPDGRAQKDGVILEQWLPDGRFSPGEWVTAHVRITNTRATPITVNCSPTFTRGDISGLLDRGRRWTGRSAAFKDRVLRENALDWVGFYYRHGDGVDCPGGDVGQYDPIRPGASLDYDVWGLPRSRVGAQPLPGGTVPVSTLLRFGTGTDMELTHRLEVGGSVRLIGPDWPWASPGELIDAALEDPFFSDWLFRRDDPSAWDNTTFHEVDGSFYWSDVGFTGPAPDGTVSMGLFAGSWQPTSASYGVVLLDPWTATVLGSDARD